jgi:hypothetical protein
MSDEISRTSPPPPGAASIEMRYLDRSVLPARATKAQSTKAITAPRIATARLNRTSAPCINPEKDGIGLIGPSSIKNTVKTKEKFSISSAFQLLYALVAWP